MNDEFTVTHSYSDRARNQVRQAANVIGIDEAYLSLLVDAFYARVRADARLGPIFEERLANDWDAHLVRMKTFWASVALSAGTYSGKPVPVHQSLCGVERADFARWLGLFRQTLDKTAPTHEAVNYLMLRAERIARSLEFAMFEVTADGIPELR